MCAEGAKIIDMPFCVAGYIQRIEQAGKILSYGDAKISINSPARADSTLISGLADRFGFQCDVVGIDV